MARPKRNLKDKVPPNQIRKIRNEHRISLEKLAQLATEYVQSLDPNEAEITFQTLGKIENGVIGLTHQWMIVMAGAFNLHIGKNTYKSWHFVADGDDLEKFVRSSEELALLNKRRALKDTEQKAFDAMTESIMETIKTFQKR